MVVEVEILAGRLARLKALVDTLEPVCLLDILSRRALPSGRLAVLGTTMDLHQGLLGEAPRGTFQKLKRELEAARIDLGLERAARR